MDCLNLANLEEKSEEKVMVFKPRVMIRKSKIKLCSRKQSSKEMPKNTPSFLLASESISLEIPKKINTGYKNSEINSHKYRRNFNNTALIFGYAGDKNLLVPSIDYNNYSTLETSPLIEKNKFPCYLRTKPINFRRLK